MQPKTTYGTEKVDEGNRGFWKAHMKALRKSGYSRAEYCRLNNLSYHALVYWQKRIRKDVKPEIPNSIVAVAQIPARQPPLQASAPLSFTVYLKDRFKIEVGENFSSDTLIRLITTLEAC